MKIQLVSGDAIQEIISDYEPHGMFVCRLAPKCMRDKRWLAVDNTSGDAWTEEFGDLTDACLWLLTDMEPQEARDTVDLVRDAEDMAATLQEVRNAQ